MALRIRHASALRVLLAAGLVAAACVFPASRLALAQSKAAGSEKNFQALADQAGQAQRAGKTQESIRLYLQALQIRPQWVDGWRNLGMLLAERKDYARAETAFKNLLQIEPKNGSAWALLGLTEFERGGYDVALRDIVHARRLGVPNADLSKLALFHEALLLIHKGEFEAAEPLLMNLVHADVNDPDLVAALGLDALRIPSFPDQLRADRQAFVNRIGAIDFQGFHGSVEEASSAYQQLIAEQPEAKGLHFAYGKMLASAGKFDQCIEEMGKELDLNPSDDMAMLQIAMTELNLNQPARSLPYAEKAVRVAPKLFASHYVLGRTLDKLAQTDRAIVELEMATKLAPSTPEIHYALFQAYSHANRKADALRERQVFANLTQKEQHGDGTP
ncbi:MAG: hypothetical protein DMG21_07865 [Acidobacteria bacterium]|nr:MAG: hypothetical protein DMG21_07865 [Acidobacteriota bacterium]